MSTLDKAERLFEYISQVYAIDLPIDRDVKKYGAELWWQAEIVQSAQCNIKLFQELKDNLELPELTETLGEDTWLSVTKRSYDAPPELPSILKEWIDLSSNPTKLPFPKPSILKKVSFESDVRRVAAFRDYIESLKNWEQLQTTQKPPLPQILIGWIDETRPNNQPPVPLESREFEERFEDDRNHLDAFNKYIEGQWKSWSERVMPSFKANNLYDELFSLYQRLTVEGDRLEVIWGHLFLAWTHSPRNIVYYPLVLTPMNLHFDPKRRNISLTPSQTITTRLDLDCLINLDHPFKEELIKYSRTVNSGESSPDVWSHNQMRGHSAAITGYLSKESADKTNLYSEEPILRPSITTHPTIHNAPVIFVRERTRRLWVDDARKVAEAIHQGSAIPPFLESLVADPHTDELPNPDDYAEHDKIDEDEGEHLLPLEYNDQQEEIVKRLKKHFGALVQGPPGTGKSHTIANIISSWLARGKRILVTTQTENALRVLRNFIPEQIRSLCVSHLGNDTESKRQLNEAVDSIGKHLGEKNSGTIAQKIRQLKTDLRSIREEQAKLRSQIRDWAEIGSCTIKINEETVTAVQAAKECSDRESRHSWFPDKISKETNPPLSDQELREMCDLLKEISCEDRNSCLQYLPDLKTILTPEAFAKKLFELRSLTALAAETEELRCECGTQLNQAQPGEITDVKALLEDALVSMQEIKNPWQLKVLELISSGANQDNFWHDFLKQCILCKESAWGGWQKFHGFRITIRDLPTDLDIEPALEELRRAIAKGRKPSGFITRITLSKAAKLLFDSAKVDGYPLLTTERIDIAKSYLSYKKHLSKIDVLWNKTIRIADGPKINLIGPMPLAEVDERVKDITCPIEWKDKYFERIKGELIALGCRNQIFHKRETIEEYLKALHGQEAEIEKGNIEKYLSDYRGYLENESSKKDSHNLWKLLGEAVATRSTDKYEQAYAESVRLSSLFEKVQRVEQLLKTLKAVVPVWAGKIEKRAISGGEEAIEQDWEIAWRWRRLDEWLKELHQRESAESLQIRLERARKREQELIVQLVNERTWQRQIANVKDYHYRALVAWADAMRRYGRTGGKYGQRYLAAATKAMVDAVGAVPAWIMPLHRVVMSFPAEPEIFDLVIVDEASQCDLRALPALFRAKKVLVVGDPEQISPAAIGIDRTKIFELGRQFLSDIPYADTTFIIENSLYHITQNIPRMDRILLTEHFRCVPEIIEFNNRLCPSYAGKLEPLRQPNPQEMLEPTIKTILVENGFKDNNDINKPEAEALVDLLVKCCKDNRYSSGGKDNRKRTMGVISLLGEKQAKYISELIAQRIDETERAERRIICGDAYAFQGDERDVMFLSLVVATNAQFASLVKESDRQRFNVGTSRARDQVFLFHSLRLADIKNPECVRYKLLE